MTRHHRSGTSRAAARCTAAAAALTAGIWGCQSILGIEDLSLGPRPDADAGTQGGSSGDGGSGGENASLGGATNQSGAGGGSSSEGMGGAVLLVDSGADAPVPGGPITVSGRVIDFFRRPVPDAPVHLGDQSVLTDDDGRFSFANVVPPYDVSLLAATTRDGFPYHYYAYVYQGLTRPDPTLQVYNGLTLRSEELVLTIENATFEVDERTVLYAFSSPDATYSSDSVDANISTLTQNWTGPASHAGNAHGLLVLRPEGSFEGEPPLAYEAYDSAPLAFSDGTDSTLTLDMAAEAVASVNLTGTVDSGTFGGQTHFVSVRFNDGTLLPLFDESSSAAAFSFLVPSLPNTSLIVAAAGGSSFTPYALAHADGVPAAADQNVALTLPRPVAPSAPGGGSDIGPETTFSWSTLGQTTGVYVWHLESDGRFEGIYVITSRSEIQYPRIPDFTMQLSEQPVVDPQNDGTYYFWWVVETHGDYPNVDAATGPDGFFDSFAYDREVGTGLSRGSTGYFTESELQVVNLVAQP